MPDYALMNQHLYEGNANEVERLTKEALAEGRSAQEVLTDGLIAGMSVVGEDFKHNVLYVPEVLIAARAMKAGMAVLKPLLTSKDGGTKPKGVLLMGTVRGDLHDIGKNLVGMMAEGAGFEVHDIGVDQSVDKFMAAAEKCKPNIIGMSALLTTTMMYMKTVIEGSMRRAIRRSRWRWAALPSARCLPTRLAPMDTEPMLPLPWICSCGCQDTCDTNGHLQDPLLAGSPDSSQS
jgi:5-methyltetrahydrofolate--homocysteine methyltransferase